MSTKSNIKEISEKYQVSEEKVIEIIEKLGITINRGNRSVGNIRKDKVKEVEEALELELNPSFKFEKEIQTLQSENSSLLVKLSKAEEKVVELQSKLDLIEKDKRETAEIVDEIGEMFFNDKK